MKKLLWLFALVVVATVLKDVVGYFGPMAAAFRAYRDEAETLARDRGKTGAFRDIDGHVVDVSYHLEAAEPAGNGEVRLTVMEAVQFQRMSEMKPFGNRRVAKTRQYVLMHQGPSGWVVSGIEADATEVVELAEVEVGN